MNKMINTTNQEENERKKQLTFVYRGNPFLDGIVEEVETGLRGSYDVQVINIPHDCSVTPAMQQRIEAAIGEAKEGRGQIITDDTTLTAMPQDLEGRLRELLLQSMFGNTLNKRATTFQNIATQLQDGTPEGYQEFYRAIARDARSAGIEEIAVVLTQQVLVDGYKPKFMGGSLADHGIQEPEGYINGDNFDSERMRRVFGRISDAFAEEGVTAQPAVCIVSKEEGNLNFMDRAYYLLPSVEAIRFQPDGGAIRTPIHINLEGATPLGRNFRDRGVFIDRHTLPYENRGDNEDVFGRRIYVKHEGNAAEILKGQANYGSSNYCGSFVTLPMEQTKTPMADYIIQGLTETKS